MSLSQRLRDAEHSLLSRYPDRDEFEIENSIKSFSEMTPEQLKEHFLQEARQRGILLDDSDPESLTNEESME